MRLIKFLVPVVLTALLGFNAYAQDKKVEFGIMAGYGYTMPKLKDSRSIKNPAINSSNLNGFHAGPVLKFNFSEQVGIQTGLLFNYFSGVDLLSSSALKKTGVWNQNRIKLTAFDLPLKIMYSMPLADEFYLQIFAGPNFNYSINKVTDYEAYSDNKLNVNLSKKGTNIYQAPSDFNSLDFQMGAGIGVQFMGLFLRGGYDWGILNRTTLDNAKLRSNDLKVSVGYTF